jgi:cytochrome b subunit of formate dehydrogenase
MRVHALLAALLLCSAPAFAAAADAAKPDANPNQACLDCHQAAKLDEPGVRPAEFGKSVHGSFACTDCHAGYEAPGPHELKPLDAADAALVKRFDDLKASPAPRAFLACGGCHGDVAEQLAVSVHGKWMKGEGAKVAGPTCAKCHGPVHEIVKSASEPANAATRFAPADRAIMKRCEACHGDPQFAEKAGLKHDVQETFQDSIHGRLIAVGSHRAPACADCHGVAVKDDKGVFHPNAHAILPKTSPASAVAPANKAATCARCHPGASQNFAALISHRAPWESDHKVPHILHVVFSYLAALTLLFFGVHVLIDLAYEIRMRFRKKEHPEDPAEHETYVQRFDIHQRVQHWMMLAGVITLGVTGWPLRGAGSPEAIETSRKFLAYFGGPGGAALVHRIAAVVIILSGAYHLGYLVLLASRKRLPMSMVPMPKDAFDMRDNILHMLGLLKDRPRFGKYSYLEKFDYWAVFWGMIMMVGTGFVLWFPVFFAQYAPHWIVTSAQIIHGEEATLALLFLFVVHFYNAHLKPSIFPMSWTWLTGKMSLAMLKHEHEGEYDELKRKQGRKDDGPHT